MPFYNPKDMEKGHSDVNPNVSNYKGVGEFMKAALVTKPEGEGPPLHMHPNEEQWMSSATRKKLSAPASSSIFRATPIIAAARSAVPRRSLP